MTLDELVIEGLTRAKAHTDDQIAKVRSEILAITPAGIAALRREIAELKSELALMKAVLWT
jgi:hypothetical protein